MKKILIAVPTLALCFSLTSCIAYDIGKAYSKSVNAVMEHSANLNREYQEAKVNRPELTMQQFMEERTERRKKEQYEKEKANRPDLTYEQFEAEWNAKYTKKK